MIILDLILALWTIIRHPNCIICLKKSMQNTSDHLFFVFLILTWLKNTLSFAFEVMLLASYVFIIIQQKYGYKSDFKKTHKKQIMHGSLRSWNRMFYVTCLLLLFWFFYVRLDVRIDPFTLPLGRDFQVRGSVIWDKTPPLCWWYTSSCVHSFLMFQDNSGLSDDIGKPPAVLLPQKTRL